MASPFSHEELEVKRRFLDLARHYLDKSNEGTDDDEQLAYELAAALLYMNVADYLAEYLSGSIFSLIQKSATRYYFSAIKIRANVKPHYNIEASINELKKYDFPGREDILAKLDVVKKARNKVAHEILKTRAQDLLEIDEAVRNLRDNTEILINMVDELQMGMPPHNMDELLAAATAIPDEDSEETDVKTEKTS